MASNSAQMQNPLSQAVIREAGRRVVPVMMIHHPGLEITLPHIHPENPLMKIFLPWVFRIPLPVHLYQTDLAYHNANRRAIR